jgi:gliding motility-associated-like protein
VKLYAFSEVSPTVVLCDQNSTIEPTLPGTNPPPPPGEPVDVTLIIPNVLTPDGDGINDLFTIQYNGNETYDLTIMNRWGSAVFTSNTPVNAWNGKVNNVPANEGVYYYTLKIGAEEYHGFLTLVR